MIDDRTRLTHIRDSIDHALAFTAEGRDAFFADLKTRHAVVRALEIIGEAVKGISESVQNTNAAVPRRQIASMRDRLIHGYFTVDLKIVWFVVENELRPLREQVETILQQLPPDPESSPAPDGNS